ncbi:MAG: CHAT domain-containing protein, partial [Fimbriimonadales bacterium]|nr:CHAT domain-containing protein [Fimbriimonadales bacterium]
GRAFLAAGSRSVGMSLWAVSDRATGALMREFYSRYVGGMAKDEALRGAQLALRRSAEYADPYYWSGFVLMGDYAQAPPPKARPSGRLAVANAPASRTLSQNRGDAATPERSRTKGRRSTRRR